MTTPALPGRLSSSRGLVYGEPITLDDGATILPVSRVRGRSSSPVGVFVLHDGVATWTPVVDANRIAQVGVLTGFVAATLSTLAVLRRPPWPDTKINITKTR
jgi:hypothetical protein